MLHFKCIWETNLTRSTVTGKGVALGQTSSTFFRQSTCLVYFTDVNLPENHLAATGSVNSSVAQLVGQIPSSAESLQMPCFYRRVHPFVLGELEDLDPREPSE